MANVPTNVLIARNVIVHAVVITAIEEKGAAN
jgi:hypothetical protein